MINNQLLEYIKKELANKTTKDSIYKSLEANGWLKTDVDEAFAALPAPTPVPSALSAAPANGGAEASGLSPAGSPTLQSKIQPQTQAQPESQLQPNTKPDPKTQPQSPVEPEPKSLPQSRSKQEYPPLVFPRSFVASNISKDATSAEPTPGAASTAYDVDGMPGMPAGPSAPAPAASVPEPTPVLQKQYVPAEPVKKLKKHHKILYWALVIVVLVLGGGGAYAYYSGMFVTLDTLLPQVFGNLQNFKSVSFDVSGSMDFSQNKDMLNSFGSYLSGTSGNGIVNLSAKGSYDGSNSNDTRISTTLSASYGADSVGLAFKKLNNTLYAQITSLPSKDLALLGTYASSLTHKWISIPLSQNSANQSLPGEDASGAYPGLAPASVDMTVIDKLTPAQKNKIWEITRSANLFNSEGRLADEEINGQDTYHFAFGIDKKGIVSYEHALHDYAQSIAADNSQVKNFDPKAVADSIDAISNFHGEIWIGKKDKLPAKLSVSFSAPGAANPNVMYKISLSGMLTNWNQPENITAPADSTSLQSLLANMFMGLAPQLGAGASETQTGITNPLLPSDTGVSGKKPGAIDSLSPQGDSGASGNQPGM